MAAEWIGQFPGWFESLVILTALAFAAFEVDVLQRGRADPEMHSAKRTTLCKPCSLDWSCFHTTLRALSQYTFQAFSVLFSSRHSGTGWSNFSHPKNAFPEVVWLFFRCFWQSLNLALLHLVANPLYLLSGSLLLIVDVDSDTPASWRVFFSWLDVVKGFYLPWRGSSYHPRSFPLWTSMPFMLLCTPVHSFFSQNVPNCWFGHSKCSCYLSNGLFCFWSLTIVCFHLHGALLWLHDVGSQQQLPNANGTLGIDSRPFTCLIDVEITKK